MAPQQSRGEAYLGTVLVIGGCGFIGSYIVEALAAEPACSRVVAASRNPNRYRIPEATYRACDITDKAQIEALLEEVKPRVIVHTVSPGVFALPAEHYRISYLGTKRVLELAKQSPYVRVFVWTSSVAAVQLDPKNNYRPISENEAILNTFQSSNSSAYERSKGATETLVLGSNTDATTVDFSGDADWTGRVLTTALRLTGLFGPRDETTIPEMLKVGSTFAARIQIGPNKQVHSWVYVDSAANAHVDAAKALLDGQHLRPDMRVDGEAFFIQDPTPMKIWDFSRAVWKSAGYPQEERDAIVVPFWVIINLARVVEWMFWIFTFGTKNSKFSPDTFRTISNGSWCAIEKARKRLGYQPVCDTQEGIRRTVAWFKEQENRKKA